MCCRTGSDAPLCLLDVSSSFGLCCSVRSRVLLGDDWNWYAYAIRVLLVVETIVNETMLLLESLNE